MKIKLLKKLHKKYNWYFNKDGFPVLINHSEKCVTLYDFEYLCKRFNYTLEDVKQKVKVEHTEWAIRCLKSDILSRYGWDMGRSTYKLAVNKYKRRLVK